MNEREEEEDAREAQLFDALTKCEMKDSRKRQKENDRRDTFVMLEAQKANLNQKKKNSIGNGNAEVRLDVERLQSEYDLLLQHNLKQLV